MTTTSRKKTPAATPVCREYNPGLDSRMGQTTPLPCRDCGRLKHQHVPTPPITYGTPRVSPDGFAVYLDLAAPANVGWRAVNAAAHRVVAACEDFAQIRDAWIVSAGLGNGNSAWVKLELCAGDSVDRAKECLRNALISIASLRSAVG